MERWLPSNLGKQGVLAGHLGQRAGGRDGADELGDRYQIPSLPHGAAKPQFPPAEAAIVITQTVITVTGCDCWSVARPSLSCTMGLWRLPVC